MVLIPVLTYVDFCLLEKPYSHCRYDTWSPLRTPVASIDLYKGKSRCKAPARHLKKDHKATMWPDIWYCTGWTRGAFFTYCNRICAVTVKIFFLQYTVYRRVTFDSSVKSFSLICLSQTASARETGIGYTQSKLPGLKDVCTV